LGEKMIKKKLFFSLLISLILFYSYVIFNHHFYWMFPKTIVFIISVIYVLIASFILYKLIPEDLLKKIKFPRPKISKTLMVFFVFILALNIFLILENPILRNSDEMTHIYRGQIGLASVANLFGIENSYTEGFERCNFNRYPPLGMLIQSLSILLFGVFSIPFRFSLVNSFEEFFYVSNFSVRFPSLIFSALSLIFLYLLTKEIFNKRTAIIATLSLALIPTYLLLTASAHLAAGEIFFILSSVYFYIRYLKSNESKYLILSGILVGIGMLYKEPILFVGIAISLSLLLNKHFFKEKIVQLIHFNLPLALIALPYYLGAVILGKCLINDSPFRLFNIPTFLSYIWVTLELITILIVFFIIFLIKFLIDKKNRKKLMPFLTPLTIICIIWFVFFSSYYDWKPNETGLVVGRLVLGVVPFIVLIAAAGLDFLVSKVNKNTRRILLAIYFITLIMISGYTIIAAENNNTQIETLNMVVKDIAIHNIRNNKYPYEETIEYLSEILEEDEQVYVYINFYNLDKSIIKFYALHKGVLKDNLYRVPNKDELKDPGELIDRMNGLGIKYALVLAKEQEKVPALDNPKFKLDRVFTFGENQIRIYQIGSQY